MSLDGQCSNIPKPSDLTKYKANKQILDSLSRPSLRVSEEGDRPWPPKT